MPESEGSFADRAHPCSCPKPVIELLNLALRYVESGGSSEKARQQRLGALEMKSFLMQPSEVWCGYVDASAADEDA